jgi:hypothetical protein
MHIEGKEREQANVRREEEGEKCRGTSRWDERVGQVTARHHRDKAFPSVTCTTLILKILTNHGASYSWPDRQTDRETESSVLTIFSASTMMWPLQ